MIQLTLISTIMTSVNYDTLLTKFDRNESTVNPDHKTSAKSGRKTNLKMFLWFYYTKVVNWTKYKFCHNTHCHKSGD